MAHLSRSGPPEMPACHWAEDPWFQGVWISVEAGQPGAAAMHPKLNKSAKGAG